MQSKPDDDRSPGMPDHYDRLLGTLDGLPGVLSTKPAIAQQVTPILGISQTFVVRTVRQQERDEQNDNAAPAAFTVFLEHTTRESRLIRIDLPPNVTDMNARQRDAKTAQAPKRTAKRVAAERKARGEVPGFMRTTRRK
jgi:hypothetical protein